MPRIWITCAVLGLAGVAAAAPEPTPIAAELKALGTRVLADLARRYPDGLNGDIDHGDIPATGPCRRPSAAQRAALKAKVAPGVADESFVSIAFGCLEPSGIIVNVAFDQVGPDHHRTGVWRVVRASTATSTVTRLAEYSGTSTQSFMEWANEIVVSARGLVDVDGDGRRDVVIARGEHEGGARAQEVTLTPWRSRDGRTSQLGMFRDDVAVIAGFRGAPALLAITRWQPEDSDPLSYRCITARGSVELCPAVVEARRVGRMAELARQFAEGAYNAEIESAIPDRDLLLEMLGALEVPKAAQLGLAAQVVATPPERRVGREIRRLLAPKVTRRFGEAVDEPVVDPQPAELAALLGDALCTSVAASAAADIAAWIRANDARALVGQGDCAAGKPCRWARPSAPTLGASCAAGIQDGPQDKPVMSMFVDGVRGAAVPTNASWFAFREPDVEAADLLQTTARSGDTYWHHDGVAWQRVVEVPSEITSALPASASPAARFLFEDHHRVFARWALKSFDPAKWSKDANQRAQTRRALVLAGADPAMLARVDAEAAAVAHPQK